ncbi:FkbM family methyltransferase [Haloferax sp. AB510]|uniref:FkbM family methyltransferase n=1 Tax=unclassified Haloferax TaxID=2625095 RepID=UPI0006944621|nr:MULTISPECIES: FkbM family methyltransferase [unclassified Haloferax]MCO8266647.1 FkbM family methyltransferase [Haloferax sp. AB510]
MSSLYEFVRRVYDPIVRPRLPKKLGYVNGVVTRKPALLDAQDTFPEYEQPIVDAINNQVEPEDTVVIVGGGYGVSAVHAGRQASSVLVYEASESQYEIVREAVRLDGLENVTLRNALVGPDVYVYNNDPTNHVVPASELPSCDVLELDCEGAELEILENLEIRPRVIIVETHPIFGVETAEVEAVLDSLNYSIVAREWEVEETRVEVLTAVRR